VSELRIKGDGVIKFKEGYKRIKPLVIPKDVVCKFTEWQIEVSGPLGTLYLDNWGLTNGASSSEQRKANIATFNKLVQNAVDGVSYGYVVKLKVRGSGYKVIRCKNRTLTLRIGHSHMCNLTIPAKVRAVQSTKFSQILCYGISKEKLSRFADRVKRLRKRTAYRAKGIFEVSEPLPNKSPGKAGKKA
jgi:ribosomal protein L6P/L9E